MSISFSRAALAAGALATALALAACANDAAGNAGGSPPSSAGPSRSVSRTAGGVTDLGSGTDQLTLYLAARYHLTTKDFTRVGVGSGSTFVAALQHGKIVCGMTTQPTVAAVEKLGIGYSAFDLATTAGVQK